MDNIIETPELASFTLPERILVDNKFYQLKSNTIRIATMPQKPFYLLSYRDLKGVVACDGSFFFSHYSQDKSECILAMKKMVKEYMRKKKAK